MGGEGGRAGGGGGAGTAGAVGGSALRSTGDEEERRNGHLVTRRLVVGTLGL